MSKKELQSKTKSYWEETVKVLKTTFQLLEASCLLVIAGFAIWAARNYGFAFKYGNEILLFAGIDVFLMAMWLYVKAIRAK